LKQSHPANKNIDVQQKFKSVKRKKKVAEKKRYKKPTYDDKREYRGIATDDFISVGNFFATEIPARSYNILHDDDDEQMTPPPIAQVKELVEPKFKNNSNDICEEMAPPPVAQNEEIRELAVPSFDDDDISDNDNDDDNDDDDDDDMTVSESFKEKLLFLSETEVLIENYLQTVMTN